MRLRVVLRDKDMDFCSPSLGFYYLIAEILFREGLNRQNWGPCDLFLDVTTRYYFLVLERV